MKSTISCLKFIFPQCLFIYLNLFIYLFLQSGCILNFQHIFNQFKQLFNLNFILILLFSCEKIIIQNLFLKKCHFCYQYKYSVAYRKKQINANYWIFLFVLDFYFYFFAILLLLFGIITH